MRLGAVDNVLLFGGGAALLACLQFLRERAVPTMVFTSPRQLGDRLPGTQITFADSLSELGVQYCVSEDIRSDQRIARHLKPTTLGLSLDAAWIFDREFIERFGGRLVNSHGARLPHFRGGGGFTWPMLRKTQLGYSLVHLITPGIDDGPIITSREYRFPTSCRYPEDRFIFAAEQDAAFLCEFLDGVLSDRAWEPIGQPNYLSTYFPRLHTPTQGFVDWNWTSEEIVTFVTAFDRPYPGASTFLRGSRVFLKSAILTPGDGHFHPFQAGLVYRMSPDLVSVAARPSGIGFQKILNEGGQDVASQVRLGDRLYTPANDLDTARTFRAIYAAQGLRTSEFQVASSRGPG